MSCGNSGRSDDEDQRQTYYAISNYTAVEDSQLSLSEGDVVDVLEKVNETWWWAEVEGETGYVPTNHLSETCPSEGVDRWQDVEYFSSYNTLKLHLEMLSDKPRTLAYRTAFETARAFIQGKVVLDLGCGTGILSVFSACLGDSRKVYAVEASDICEQAERVISHNSLSEKVSVIQTKAEDLELPEKVDLIVSEWMGTMLLCIAVLFKQTNLQN
ncbi:Protein arginine N-methyltransferase 2, partial [Geodia barretti]